jgi:hypothetical protein
MVHSKLPFFVSVGYTEVKSWKRKAVTEEDIVKTLYSSNYDISFIPEPEW